MNVFNIKSVLALAATWLFTSTVFAGFTSFQSQPNSVFVNTSTQVKFVADIAPTPSLIKQSVNLLRQTPSGPKVVGNMRDDGLLGDTLANDNKFTLQVILNEANATQLGFRVSAAYKGIAQRDQSAPIFVDVVAGNSLQISAGQSEITIPQGQSASTAFSLEIFNQGGAQANLTALESINPPSGLGLVSDYPGGWSTNATNKTFLVQNTFTGNQVGDYEVTLTGTLNLNGTIQQTAKILVHVTDGSGIGKLSLTAWPGGLQTGAAPETMEFSSEYYGGEKIPLFIVLDEVDVFGTKIAELGNMNDDGNDPDLSLGDQNYGRASVLTPGTQPAIRYFRATAFFDDSSTVQSKVFELPIAPYAIGFISPNPLNLVEDVTSGQKFVCDQVMVAFKEGVSITNIESLVNSINGDIVGFLPLSRTYQIQISCNGTQGVLSVVATLKQSPLVSAASPNLLGGGAAVSATDPSVSQQWSINKVRADEAWVIARGGSLIAVLDTGVDYNHEDLTGRVIKGKDFVNNDNDPMDDHGHGTSVAGIAAASGNNGKGIAGMSWNSKILAIKVTDSSNSGFSSNAAKGIDYAVAKGARILNLSWGLGANPSDLSNSITNAVSPNRLVIAAAGNGNKQQVVYPCGYSGVLCVGATDQTDGRWVQTATFGSNHGSHIKLWAPGGGIYTTSPTALFPSGYAIWSGTSHAAPLVSGTAALIWERYPSWTSGQVIDRLMKTAVSLSGIGPRVDAFEAVFNGSFEHDLSGWKTIGTASALDNLGPFISPTAGKKMGMASSGPDATVSQSELYQEFTVQPGVTSVPIQFNYAMITEEYPEFVGQGFNDDIIIELVTPNGTRQLAVETVDGSSFSLIGGIDFPGGDSTVGWTGWKPVNITVPVPPGGATFNLRVRDQGDGIYDTNAIIDNIRFK